MDLTKPSHILGLITALAVIITLAIIFSMKKDTPGDTTSSANTSSQKSAATAPEVPQTETASKTTPTVATGAIIKTNYGEIEVAFFGAEAQKTVKNFQKLVETGFYTDTKFHRVIKNFMIQAGDPLTKDDAQMQRWGTGGPGYTFEDEINDQKIVRGVLAMANAGPNTNGSQFFIVTVQATPWLDGLHTVFGKVVRGMDVVDQISLVQVMQNDIPKSPVVVESIVLK